MNELTQPKEKLVKKKSFHQSSNSPMFTYATQPSLKDKKPH